jgi:hypothetical protein
MVPDSGTRVPRSDRRLAVRRARRGNAASENDLEPVVLARSLPSNPLALEYAGTLANLERIQR